MPHRRSSPSPRHAHDLRIRNWDKWQSYRRDRGQPPWIKIHRRLMHDPRWVELSDAQRGQLVSIWVLAADRDGYIPDSRSLVRKLCLLDADPDLDLFIRQGFIEPRRHPDANVASSRRHSDVPETETEIEKPLVGETADDGDPSATIKDLHAHFNAVRGSPRPLMLTKDREAKYRARLRRFTPDQIKAAIDSALANPFFRGDNSTATRYDYPETVLRNDAAIDRHLDRANGARPPGSVMSPEQYADHLQRREEVERISKEVQSKIAIAGIARRQTASNRKE